MSIKNSRVQKVIRREIRKVVKSKDPIGFYYDLKTSEVNKVMYTKLVKYDKSPLIVRNKKQEKIDIIKMNSIGRT